MNIARPLRIIAAVALFVGGLIHLQLYFEGYRSIAKIGPSFLVNAVASAVVAALLVARREWFVRVAGMGVAAGTVGAFILSRQGNGLFDFREHGLTPSPQAIIALVVEVAAIVLLGASFLPVVGDDGGAPRLRSLGVSTAIAAVTMVAFGAFWANHYDSSPLAPAAGGVQIVNFAFGPADITIHKGATLRWTNGDATAHSVVATDASYFSQNLGRGMTFEHTFDAAGTYQYVCGIHSQMHGSITVTN